MARKRASMREGPLAELFRATEAAQKQDEQQPPSQAADPGEPDERTVEHIPTWEEAASAQQLPPEPPTQRPDPAPQPPPGPDPEPPTPRRPGPGFRPA